MKNIKSILNKILPFEDFCFLLLCIALCSVPILFFPLSYVHGTSMDPTLKDGDLVILTTLGDISDGDIVIVDTSKNNDFYCDKIIKRYYADKSDEHSIWVEGDNYENSYDSRSVGKLNRKDVYGKMVINVSEIWRDLESLIS